jgi:hypothetical protein
MFKTDQIEKTLEDVECVQERNVYSFVVNLAEQFDNVLSYCDRRILEIADRNEFWEDCVKDECRSVSYVVLKARCVQSSVCDLTRHDAHDN